MLFQILFFSSIYLILKHLVPKFFAKQILKKISD